MSKSVMTDPFRVPAPEAIKKFKAFQGLSFNNSRPPSRSFYSIEPYWYLRENTPIWSIRAWCLLIISGLSSSSTHLIATMAGSSHSHQVLLKVSHTQIPNFSRPSTRFPKQFKDIFSFMKFKDFSRLAVNSRPAQEPCPLVSTQYQHWTDIETELVKNYRAQHAQACWRAILFVCLLGV